MTLTDSHSAAATALDEQYRARLHLLLRGAVQGLGFRPLVCRLARLYGLTGWVRNAVFGVEAEVEGRGKSLHKLLAALDQEREVLGIDFSVTITPCTSVEDRDFVILDSAITGKVATHVIPDRAVCRDCRAELFDQGNRRYRYPFTHCARCGPRYSIIERLPYDRERTAMRGFTPCALCLAEYDNPIDRRFHAQPIACGQCGPQVSLWDDSGRVLARRDDALKLAVAALRRGEILAVKGLGGFQLLVDARNAAALARLRRVKRRSEKPFAVMGADEAAIAALVTPDPLEWSLLCAAEAPIVLVRKGLNPPELATTVAPGYADLGVMLPTTPLHHLLLSDAAFSVVVTSGNRSGDYLCLDEQEALQRLAGMADYFLVHDRPVLRAVDDSVVRVVAGCCQVLRSARGYAPQTLAGPVPGEHCLAVGGHQNSTIALSVAGTAVLSPHIGNLDSADTRTAHTSMVSSLTQLYDTQMEHGVVDLHPDYASSLWLQRADIPLLGVQHHYAHAVSCMVDNGLLNQQVLAVVWDGSGYGDDGTLWGGEFLDVDQFGFKRAAYWRPFPLPGGAAAVRAPSRVAFGLLYEIYQERVMKQQQLHPLRAIESPQQQVLLQMLKRRVNTPLTSSVGRLFDAVSALLGLCQQTQGEGHAACLVEARALGAGAVKPYPVALVQGKGAMQLDWEPLLRALLADLAAQRSLVRCAARFQRGLVEGLLLVAHAVGRQRVVLSGGCFQNRYLTECAIEQLRASGFEPFWHRRIPPNDGGLAIGQLFAARGAS